MPKNLLYYIPIIILFFICIFFFFSLNNDTSKLSSPIVGKEVPEFFLPSLFLDQNDFSSSALYSDDPQIVNVWASWCIPCRKEHPFLMHLSKNSKINLIGLNYKDRSNNAKKFINDFGNPFSTILIDPDGTISIELGAYGIPETIIINKDQKIIKKFIGPLTNNNLKEIERIVN